MNKKPDVQDRLDKLQTMANWFDNDPALFPLFRELFSIPTTTTTSLVAAPSHESDHALKPRKKYTRRGGSLLDHVEKSLRDYCEQTTAKELAQYMAASGIKFKARDPEIAVSKALRHLAKMGRINAQRGGHSKAPIIYWSLQPTVIRASEQIPGQERITH
jgi:hypothetical protein